MKQATELSNRTAGAIAGPLLVVASGVPMLYFYAFASMINPELSRRQYYEVLFSKLYLGTESIVTVPLTFALLVGLFLCLRAVYELVLG